MRAHSSEVPRTTGPAPRIPAATAPCSDPGSAASVIRAATFVGIIPCSAIATRSTSRKKRSSSIASRPVRSRWKYSVKVSRPMRSPARSCPRTSTRSGYAWLIRVTAFPGLPIGMRSPAQLVVDQTRTGDHRLELAKRALPRQVFHPAVRSGDEPLGREDGERPTDPPGDDLGCLDLARAEVEDAQDDHLVGNAAKHVRVEVRLRGLEREMGRGTVVQLVEERVPGEPVVDDVRVPEARVEHGLALDAGERPVDRLERVLPRRLGTGLEVRLVDLDDVRARRLEVVELLVDRFGIREREALAVGVVVVLGLLRHRERPGNGDLDPAIRDRAEELDVPDLDRPRAADRADDPWDGVLVPRAIEGDAGRVQIDAVERCREAVAVALAPHLPVGDDVD